MFILRFPDHVMDMLRELKEKQDRKRIKLCDIWVDTDRLFTQAYGKPMNNNTPYYWVKRFCKRNNLHFCDLHSLRHFYASALINEGVDAAAVSGALGHS
ncbi:MAG: tyrosine-type recombinase/integrase, partial [Oscillospiraceae bacterium]|nr:tyrosine-type recombinase/integrase [Oscillospiraceae bacterium]